MFTSKRHHKRLPVPGKCLLVLMLACLYQTVTAQEVHEWKGTLYSHNWLEPSGWSGGIRPGPDSYIYIRSNSLGGPLIYGSVKVRGVETEKEGAIYVSKGGSLTVSLADSPIEHVSQAFADVGAFENVEEMILYPNPVSNIFTLRLLGTDGTKAEVQVYSESGRRVHMPLLTRTTDAEASEFSFDASALSEGLYLLKTLLPDRQTVLKFIKAH